MPSSPTDLAVVAENGHENGHENGQPARELTKVKRRVRRSCTDHQVGTDGVLEGGFRIFVVLLVL